jgi:hypothetical protein
MKGQSPRSQGDPREKQRSLLAGVGPDRQLRETSANPFPKVNKFGNTHDFS